MSWQSTPKNPLWLPQVFHLSLKAPEGPYKGEIGWDVETQAYCLTR